jgi:ribosomal-protein-alanine N-acetyltransferase
MPTIHTPRLVLRPYESKDWESFRALVENDELMGRLSGPLTSKSARNLLDRLIAHDPACGVLGWAVTTKRDGDYCGHVFIHNYNHDERSAELGFVLIKRFHGQRLAAEMAAAALEYARTALGCDSVSATVDEDNEPSKAVLARIGMSVRSRRSDSDGSYLVYSDRPAEAG